MRFRQFLQVEERHNLLEQHWVTFEAPQTINGVHADGMDFRFEDWKLGFKDTPPQMASKDMPNAMPFLRSNSWRGQCKEGWLVIDQRKSKGGAASMGSLAIAPKAQMAPDIQVIPEVTPEVEAIPALPDGWYEFCFLTLKGQMVKPPLWSDNERMDRFDSIQAAQMAPTGVGQTELKPTAPAPRPNTPLRVED